MKKTIRFTRNLAVILLGFTLCSNNLEAATLQNLNQNNTSVVVLG